MSDLAPFPTHVVAGREVHRDLPVDLPALALLDETIDEKILGPLKYNVPELIEATGWSPEELAELFLWSGTPVGDPEARLYSQGDLDGLKELKDLAVREDLSNQSVGTLARSISFSMERLALTQVENIVHELTLQGRTDTAARIVAAEIAPEQGEVLLGQIAALWRRNFAGAVHRLTTGAILHRGVSDDDRQFPLICAVGYVRIADFTEITAGFDVDAYADFVQRFNNSAADIINAANGRIIKLMGDLAVWVTANAEASAEIALSLSQLSNTGFPGHLQCSITWCRVMSIHGDIFGPGVNLAAKLCEAVPADGVYIDDEAAAQLSRHSQFSITAAPTFEIKGLGTITPHLLTASGI